MHVLVTVIVSSVSFVLTHVAVHVIIYGQLERWNGMVELKIQQKSRRSSGHNFFFSGKEFKLMPVANKAINESSNSKQLVKLMEPYNHVYTTVTCHSLRGSYVTFYSGEPDSLQALNSEET